MIDPDFEIAPYRRLANAVLRAESPAAKIAAAEAAARAVGEGAPLFALGDGDPPPDRPARPAKPELKPPADVPRRRLGSPAGRAALLHAVAHIELNAIDLAFDMAARFAGAVAAASLDAEAFIRDWIMVGADEARHFAMIERRLADLDTPYGALPAHDGLWLAAQDTADDVLARLAIAPMVLEARGLDVTPAMIDKLQSAGDPESADILGVIYREEVDHVRKGVFWFNAVCARRGLEPAPTFEALVRERFAGTPKPPFNTEARGKAGLAADYYAPFEID